MYIEKKKCFSIFRLGLCGKIFDCVIRGFFLPYLRDFFLRINSGSFFPSLIGFTLLKKKQFKIKKRRMTGILGKFGPQNQWGKNKEILM